MHRGTEKKPRKVLSDRRTGFWTFDIPNATQYFSMFVDPCIIVQFIQKKSNNMQQCIKLYYSIFIWSSTCFGRHTAHHQEPKTALVASGLPTRKVVWTCGCWTLSSNHTSKQPYTYAKPEAASAVLGSWLWALCRPKHVEL